ncbi:hypothetical protein CHARACLAT_008323 [Characodon lateralis]|uniref:Fibronectin type-III domain-containing protein n=1 Tax=Characodon lateralis TaxID=208331 RepID=A0ABU7D511_9TELE|nr:hypothetical protein [Characodon lateralis]
MTEGARSQNFSVGCLRQLKPPHRHHHPITSLYIFSALTQQQTFSGCSVSSVSRQNVYGGTMGLWTLLLLHLHLAVCVSLPAPSNVSISSYNMEHILRFSPGPGTPSNAYFTVQISNSRKQRWKTVPWCAALMAGQTCNLTNKLNDVFDHYIAQARAFRTNQTSKWTKSREFQPLTDSEGQTTLTEHYRET